MTPNLDRTRQAWGAEHLRRCADLYIVAILIVFAGIFGVTVTRDLSWPYDFDHFRDMAFTQTMAQGAWLSDPHYRGEYVWYNPLLPAIAALVERLGNVPVHVVYARLGAYVNLLAPVAFFLLLRATLGPVRAVAATVVFLFAVPRGGQGWNTATYSPWLFPTTFAQTLFYLSLLALHRLWQSPSTRRRIVAGVLVGLTFLAHTAPMLMLVGILLLRSTWTIYAAHRDNSPAPWRVVVQDVGIVMGLAAVISLPLTYPIVGHYGLRILNDAPRTWVYELLLIQNIRGLLYTHATVATFFALIGFVGWLRRGILASDIAVLTWWGLVNVLLFLRGYAAQVSPLLGRLLPSLVPEFHYLFYLRGLLAVCAGCGFVVVATWLGRQFFRLRSRSKPAPTGATISSISAETSEFAVWFSYALIIVVVLLVAPRLGKRFDFGGAIQQARDREAHLQLAMYRWIRDATPVDSVFLAPDDLALFVIGPTGRKVVVVGAAYSNPYVDYVQRARDRDQMYASLFAGDEQAFCQRAQRYHVTHVALPEGQSSRVPAPEGWIKRSWAGDGVQVWTVVGCGIS